MVEELLFHIVKCTPQSPSCLPHEKNSEGKKPIGRLKLTPVDTTTTTLRKLVMLVATSLSRKFRLFWLLRIYFLEDMYLFARGLKIIIITIYLKAAYANKDNLPLVYHFYVAMKNFKGVRKYQNIEIQ